MPFKSKAQYRKFLDMESKGEIRKGTTEQWLKETKNFKRLPEHVKKVIKKTKDDTVVMVPKQANDRESLMKAMGINPNEIDINESNDLLKAHYVPAFMGNKPTIEISKNMPLGMLSHELGHHVVQKEMGGLSMPYSLLRLPILVSTAFSPFMLGLIKNYKLRRGIALALTLSNLPTLAEEAIASVHGIKGMNEIYDGDAKKIIPQTIPQGLGWLTYAATALTPLLSLKR